MLEHHFSIAPYTGYVVSWYMRTLITFHDCTIAVIQPHPNVRKFSIKVPSPIQAIATLDKHLLVLTKTRLVLIYHLESRKLWKTHARLNIPNKDVLDAGDMVMHDTKHFSFLIYDSLWVADLDDLANPVLLGENVTVIE